MENLGIDLKLLIAQAINFALFFFVFKKFLVKPFSKFIAGEKNKEEEKEKLLAEAKKQEELLKKKEESLNATMKRQADKIVDEAKKSAELLKKEILDEAAKEAELIREKAKKQLGIEKETLNRSARDKVLEFSFFLVNKALKDFLTPEARKKITELILKSSPKKVSLYEN